MFTNNIVLEALQSYRGSHHLVAGMNKVYKWVAMLPETSEEMEHDTLYVCTLSEAIKRNTEVHGHNYLCIRDRFTDDDDDDAPLLRGMVIIDENKDVSWLLNIVQNRFLQISEWVTKMQTALIENCDYQVLVNLCEPILDNFVSVLDSSYKLLAYTKNITSSDPIVISLLEKGYHTEETLQKFRDRKRFKVYEQEHGVIVSSPGEISKFEVVSKWCRYGGEPLLHVVAVCSKTPLSLATIDLFSIFMKYVDICFQRQQHAHPSQIYSSLLHEMLYGELSNPFVIGERAKTADVPFYGQFDAYRIVFKDNSTVLIGRFVQELMAYLPNSRVVAYNYEVSAFNIYSTPDVKKRCLANLEKLTPLFEKYGAICGASETFATLAGFKDACTQATRAHTLGIQLKMLGNFWQFNSEVYKTTALTGGSDVYFYNDVYIHLTLHMAQSGNFDALTNTMHINALGKLVEYDRENNSNLVQILYAHIVSERRATASGKLLHMHRNNVLYHISRIEEITGVDLDDYWNRLKLMLAFHFCELQESNKRFFLPTSNPTEDKSDTKL